ncbi:MAG: RHS repeat-associated core domain-containing protein [Pseudomonadota bacterium]
MLGAPLTQIDAKGNAQRHAYDQAGQFKGSWLTQKGHAEQVIVGELSYSAVGKKLHEVQGNGVLTTYTYDAQNLRLVGIKTERPAGHRSGARILQDLRYAYDPVGNVLSVRNEAEATRFWRNQQIVAQSLFVYDSLYQLIESSGREMANSGPLPPLVPIPPDNSTYMLYTRHYCYDQGGNLIQVRHLAPATDNNYTLDITVSSRTNRAVPRVLAQEPHAVDALFDAGGHQLQLQPGQSLAWTLRGELQQASDGTASSQEHYRYGGNGMRVSKVNVQQRGNEVQTLRVTYLPGLELRTTHQGERVSEDWHTLVMGEGGRAQVRVLHWAAGRPSGISDNQVRYSYDNLLGSSGLEVDADGEILSLEEYYPYGGTAIWSASSLVEADYKTVRYSGKERDATGLYYYGYRYYQPWVCRWLSVDPAGTIEGLNVFQMVRNNPVTLADDKGLAPADDAVKNAYHRMITQGRKFRNNMFDPPIGYDDIVEVDTAVDIVARQSERNIEQLTKRFEAVELDARGSELMLGVVAGPYTIEHFSQTRFIASDGSAHFQSRQQLSRSGVDFNWENTTEEDVDALATDDFAFFSLSLKGGREKTSSAFGNYRYQADLDAIGQHQEYALMQTHDLLMPGDRPDASKVKRSVIASKDKREFKKGISRRLGKKKGGIVVGSIFMGADIKPGLAFSFAADFMKMGGKTKERIVARMSQDANSVVQTFYRPQYLVPGGMRLHKDQYKLSYHS